MALLTLETVKRHLRVFHDDDDDEIALYQSAAESIVINYLDRPVLQAGATLPDPNTDDAVIVTDDIVHAILLLIGNYYELREADAESHGDAILPRAARAALAPYRVWRTFQEDAPPCG